MSAVTEIRTDERDHSEYRTDRYKIYEGGSAPGKESV